ncbi:MAG: putative toxin-antitoxin system toxin component, PIN family [Bacteroidales bacterium]|jgi:putative PIN family toxin of toxin-antitoxin system|nr:putative toxin-antitoxin system toxin component, PIN family [Bacteroidales bacterium]MCI2133470.1 putative toxin-antitoxin system toxin component, PIN family [Bacteroidales bacterium]
MGDKVYAVIDTNVIVSALISSKPDSYPLTVLSHVYLGPIIPVYNDEILSEYRDVLYRDKFHLKSEDIELAIRTITETGLNVVRTSVQGEDFLDPKDVMFYEVKMSRYDAYLVTGNIKHFPKKPFVVTPKEMVEILNGGSSYESVL